MCEHFSVSDITGRGQCDKVGGFCPDENTCHLHPALVLARLAELEKKFRAEQRSAMAGLSQIEVWPLPGAREATKKLVDAGWTFWKYRSESNWDGYVDIFIKATALITEGEIDANDDVLGSVRSC